MRIGIVTTSYPRFAGDFAGCFVHDFARQLLSLGHQVEVLAPQAPNIPNEEEYEGIRVFRIRYAPNERFARTFYGRGIPDQIKDPSRWFGIPSFPFATRISQRFSKWKLAFCHFPLMTSYALPPTFPKIHVWHSSDVFATKRLPTHMQRSLHRRATLSWFISQKHHDLLVPQKETFGHQTLIQPMLNRPFSSLTNKQRRERGLVISRLIPLKGVDDALSAAIKASLPLTIAGDGQSFEALNAQAKQSNLQHVFTGGIYSDAHKSHLLETHSAFFHLPKPSRFRQDGFPITLLEAASHELPIIVRPSDAIAEHLEHERTALFASSVNEAATLLRRLQQSPTLAKRITTAAKEECAYRFGPTSFREALTRSIASAHPART